MTIGMMSRRNGAVSVLGMLSLAAASVLFSGYSCLAFCPVGNQVSALPVPEAGKDLAVPNGTGHMVSAGVNCAGTVEKERLILDREGWADPEEKECLISGREDFESFVRRVRDGETGLDAKLANDIVLNDITAWEDWMENPPDNTYAMIPEYEGCFDGCGYALIGYYSDSHPVFGEIAEGGCLKNLEVRASLFASLYENREKDGEEVYVNPAAGLCGYNYGRIADCSLEGIVAGDGMAAGIAVYNDGVIEGCSFSGSVEAGRCILREEEGLDIDCPRWRAGGIAAVNFKDGSVTGCVNHAEVMLYADGLKVWRDGYLDDVLSETCAGGIVGKNNGSLEKCRNEGRVSCARTAGGIAGANSGKIEGCGNKGEVLLLAEKADVIRLNYFENEERVAGGISGYNTGEISNCYHAGSASRESAKDPGYVFGIAQSANWVFDGEGTVRNCYYLQGLTEQKYRQYGTYKLSGEEMEDIEEYLYGEKALAEVEGFRTMYKGMEVAGTDGEDYISLSLGPEEDQVYEVKEGDSLWKIAEDFYGDGTYYRELLAERPAGGHDSCVSKDGFSIKDDFSITEEKDILIYPGEKIVVPHLTYYLLRALGEREFYILEAADENGGSRKASAFAKKEQAGWLYVYYGAYTAGEKGLSVLCRSKEESETWLLADAEPAIFSSCIFFSVTSNQAGDFFANDWEGVKGSIRDSADAYLGGDCWGLRFYRYILDNGENLYGYSFRCYGFQPGTEQQQVIDCTVFYRMREGLLAEFIGVETHRADSDMHAAVRYLAAGVDGEIAVTEEPVCACSEYLGRKDWGFGTLHNPFALVKGQGSGPAVTDF